MTSSAVIWVFIFATSLSRSVGVSIPTSLPSSTTGILCILISVKTSAASAMLAVEGMVFTFRFMMSESWSSSNLLNTSFLETIPTSCPSEERTTGSPVSLCLTIRLMALLRLPGTSATMGMPTITSATVFISYRSPET